MDNTGYEDLMEIWSSPAGLDTPSADEAFRRFSRQTGLGGRSRLRNGILIAASALLLLLVPTAYFAGIRHTAADPAPVPEYREYFADACQKKMVELPDGSRRIDRVYLLTNIDHTNEHFSIDPKEQLAAVKDMRANGLKPLGNWHSHPESPSRPSEEDKRLAADSKASYLILSLMEEGNPVLNAFHIETVDGEKTVRKEELIIKEG